MMIDNLFPKTPLQSPVFLLFIPARGSLKPRRLGPPPLAPHPLAAFFDPLVPYQPYMYKKEACFDTSKYIVEGKLCRGSSNLETTR